MVVLALLAVVLLLLEVGRPLVVVDVAPLVVMLVCVEP